MLKIEKMHPMDDYLALLRESDTIYIDCERLDWATKDAGYTADDLTSLVLLYLRIEASGGYTSVSAENLIDYLESTGVDMEKRFRNRRVKGISFDMKRVVEPLIESGIEPELLSTYRDRQSYKSYSNFLRKLGVRRKVAYTTSDGRVILGYPTVIQERENLRVYYNDIAVVSVPKKYSNIITVPKEGYHLAWCDYPQADWRFAYNLFIKEPRNYDIMRNCEDAYEGLARIVEGSSFDLEEFKGNRKDYKVNCLKVFYNSRDNHPIPAAMRNYFMSCENYRKYVHDLEILYHFKLPIPCTSYFGFMQLLPEAAYLEAFLSKGLNTPIQTFTSHIVNETVFGILERFYDLGYTKEDIGVYYVRHDEPIFWFRDTIIKDAWVFKDCEQIHIDGFTPIKLDFHFGDYYREEDPDLMVRMNPSLESYQDKLHVYPVGELREYNPVPSVESFYIQFFVDTSKTGVWKVAIYDYRTKTREWLVSSKETREEALYDAITQFCSKSYWPRYILVYNEGIDLMNSIGPNEDTLLKVIAKYDSLVAVTSEN